ncbi:MAG: septum formation family protein [Pseudonocardia sp.]|nr:septum formation family protein [Pseudonocardia sp.]
MDPLFTPSGEQPTRAVALEDPPVRAPRRDTPGNGDGTPAPRPTRAATRRAPGPSAPGPRRPGGLPSVRQARRVVIGVLVGALTMLGVATLDTVAGATVPVLGSFAALPSPTGTAADEAEEAPPPPTTPGTCLNWSRKDAADTAVVECAQPHLFEQAGTVALTDQPALPDDRTWQQLVNERCTPVVLGYLNGKFDPDGRYRVGALKPSQKKWDDGNRDLRCGLQSASHSGALYPMTGRAAEQDQSGVYEPGTCLAIDGRTVGDPISCDLPHAVETVGIVDLGTKFPDAFPAVGDQDNFLQPECSRIAADYAGGQQVVTDKKLTVYWDNLTDESWNAGTRKVNCNLAALLPDRSGFAPVTGPVKGSVSVSDQVAPPASATPGVPAGPTSTPAPEPSVPVDPSTAPSSEAPTSDAPPPSGVTPAPASPPANPSTPPAADPVTPPSISVGT